MQGSSVKWAVGKLGTTGAMRARWCPLRRPQAGELGRAEQRNGLEARTNCPRASKLMVILPSSATAGKVLVAGGIGASTARPWVKYLWQGILGNDRRAACRAQHVQNERCEISPR